MLLGINLEIFCKENINKWRNAKISMQNASLIERTIP